MTEQVVLQLSKAVFAKDCSYFIAVQFGRGEAVQKFRTEVSEPSSSPTFTRNTFAFDVPAGVAALARAAAMGAGPEGRRGDGAHTLQFALFVMLPGKPAAQVHEMQPPSESKLLGSTAHQLTASAQALMRGDNLIRRLPPSMT